MNVEVFLTSNNVEDEDVKGCTVIVIDVLRASSTIATALHQGARAVVPAADMADAGKMAANLDPSSYLMGGERDGIKIEGYHLGNSPLEYHPEIIQGKTIILKTTNGTEAITRASAARHLLVGSFLNADRVVSFVKEANLDVVIICAGWHNRVALEDTLCAGLLLHRIWDGKEDKGVSDTSHIAFTQYEHDKHELEQKIHYSSHAQRLINQGYGDDVTYCLQHNTLPILPYYQDNRLALYDQTSSHASEPRTKVRLNPQNT